MHVSCPPSIAECRALTPRRPPPPLSSCPCVCGVCPRVAQRAPQLITKPVYIVGTIIGCLEILAFLLMLLRMASWVRTRGSLSLSLNLNLRVSS